MWDPLQTNGRYLYMAYKYGSYIPNPFKIPINSLYVILGFTLCNPYINGDPCDSLTESLHPWTRPHPQGGKPSPPLQPRRRTPMTSCTDSLRMESMTSDRPPKPNKKRVELNTRRLDDGMCLLVGVDVFVASKLCGWLVLD